MTLFERRGIIAAARRVLAELREPDALETLSIEALGAPPGRLRKRLRSDG